MKNYYLLVLLTFLLNSFSRQGFAQSTIDFEPNGTGASYSWNVFENSDNPALTVVDNPFVTGLNTSTKVAKFIARAAGQPYAGAESVHGNFGPLTFSASNSTVKIMVYKTVISNVGLKFSENNGEAQPEVKVANTKINEWEELTFDLSGSIGKGITGIIDQIIIFPDFATRGQENIIYFDNISFSGPGGASGSAPTTAAATPTAASNTVLSVFSDAYTNIAGTDFNPNWNQTTVASQVSIAGNNTLKYEGLNFQGIQLGSAQDVSSFDYIHVDYWTSNSTALNISLISTGPNEDAYAFSITKNQWVGVDIPLTEFSSPLALNDIIQLKFDGNGTVFLDNIYFGSGSGGTGGGGSNIAAIDFEPEGEGADYTWNVFENSDNPAVTIVANPFPSGINTSGNVAKFTVRQTGQPYAGVESAHGDFGPLTFSASNSTVKIMVYKTVISDVGLKFSENNGEAQPEVKVANTKINQWEELTFDLSGSIGKGITGVIDQIIVFPDFKTRSQENIVYFDNITFSGPDGGGGGTDEYTLVWSDEFSTDGSLNVDQWFHQTQLPAGGGWYNGEEQHYTNRIENSFASNGFLNIVAKKESFTDQGQTKQYTSARLNSKYAFTYGRVDVRAKLASGAGTWPAIWCLGKNINEPGGFWVSEFGTVDWPATGEIDIMEHWGNNPNVIHGSIHTPSSSGATVNTSTTVISDVSTTFHVYSMIWDENQIQFLVDDVAFYTYNPSVKDASTWPFNEPQYLLLNIAMGGIGGTIDPNFTESTMEIDYVRVYQNGSGSTATEPVVAAPVPTKNASEVLSVFSDTYTNVSGTNFNPDWNQTTVASQVNIAGNNTLKYEGLNYQGIELGSTQDVSGYGSLHIDYWTANSTALNVYLISTGPNEDAYAIPIVKNDWISLDIPLTEFASPVAYNDIIQLKFDGNGTIYLDNIYFSGQPGGGGGTGNLVSLPMDFETTPVTADFVDFDGGTASVIANPHATGENTSAKVAQIVRNGGAIWAGSKLILDGKIDFSNNNAFKMKVYSSRADVPVLFKLEGPGAAKEVFVNTTKANEWETLSWDYTETPSNTFDQLVFIFDFGTVGDGGANSTFLFDDIEFYDNTGGLSRLELPVTFEEATINYTMSDFGGNMTVMGIDPTNESNHIAITTKTTGSATWAGTTVGTEFGFGTAIPFTQTATMLNVKVYSPAAGTLIRMKVEDHKDETLTAETEATTTLANAWEVLTFDFSQVATGTNPFNLGTNFDKLSIFFDFGTEGSNQVYLWDDVYFGEGIPIEQPLSLQTSMEVVIFSNKGQVFINGQQELINSDLDIYNLSGRLVYSGRVLDKNTILNLNERGIMIIRILDTQGQILSKKVFID